MKSQIVIINIPHPINQICFAYRFEHISGHTRKAQQATLRQQILFALKISSKMVAHAFKSIGSAHLYPGWEPLLRLVKTLLKNHNIKHKIIKNYNSFIIDYQIYNFVTLLCQYNAQLSVLT